MKTDNFDLLKSVWQSKTDEAETDLQEIVSKAKTQLDKDQKRLIFTNLFISVSFAGVFIVMALIWSNFPDRSIYFYNSLLFMGILLIGMLVLMWLGVQFKSVDSSANTRRYIKQAMLKVKIRMFALRFATPIFMLLLLAAFFFYYADIFAGEPYTTYFLAYGGTTAYIGLVFFLSNKKRKRKLAENNHLLVLLNTWLENMEQPNEMASQQE